MPLAYCKNNPRNICDLPQSDRFLPDRGCMRQPSQHLHTLQLFSDASIKALTPRFSPSAVLPIPGHVNRDVILSTTQWITLDSWPVFWDR